MTGIELIRLIRQIPLPVECIVVSAYSDFEVAREAIRLSAVHYLLKPLSERDVREAALLLRDVHYVIEAHFDVTDKAAPGDNPGKFQDIVKRRIQRGQFYHQPCFGCREFPAQFRWCEELPPCPEELKGPRDLGWMLYDMDYTDPEDIRPLFFRASLEGGVLRVPGRNSREVRG